MAKRRLTKFTTMAITITLAMINLHQSDPLFSTHTSRYYRGSETRASNHHKTSPTTLCSSFSQSDSLLWKNLEVQILNASYTSQEHASNINFTRWVDYLFHSHYQVQQLRRSSSHPANPTTVMSLMQIISDRLAFLKIHSNGDVHESPPLHILVMGGSVAAGHNCGENPVGLPAPRWQMQHTSCAWPMRLENLFNQALFQGLKVVKVTNLSTGGASSEIGKVVLEYQLFSEEVKKESPHVVIWAHAPNDAQEANKDAVFYQHMPGFVHSARNLRMCDDELPLIVMLEDFYGGLIAYDSVNKINGFIYKVSSWFGLMSVSHANVIKHSVYANFDNSSFMERAIGGGWNLHLGMGVHIGVAWTLLFNFLTAFSDYCNDAKIKSTTASSDHVYTKYVSQYEKDGSFHSIPARWRENKHNAQEFCDKQKAQNTTSPCTYAFMVNGMTDIRSNRDLSAKLNEVLTSNDGWVATGNPVRQPRTGWYAEKANATFSIKIVATMETKYMTIMSMKSYGPNFVGTKLEVKVYISRLTRIGMSSEALYEITGYHETMTSIHVPYKCELPGGSAFDRDTILVDVRSSNGTYFKINGLAFCAY